MNTVTEVATRWPLASRLLEWASVTTLLLVVAWRPSTGPNLVLDFVVWALAAVLALTLMFARELEVHSGGRS